MALLVYFYVDGIEVVSVDFVQTAVSVLFAHAAVVRMFYAIEFVLPSRSTFSSAIIVRTVWRDLML